MAGPGFSSSSPRYGLGGWEDRPGGLDRRKTPPAAGRQAVFGFRGGAARHRGGELLEILQVVVERARHGFHVGIRVEMGDDVPQPCPALHSARKIRVDRPAAAQNREHLPVGGRYGQAALRDQVLAEVDGGWTAR